VGIEEHLPGVVMDTHPLLLKLLKHRVESGENQKPGEKIGDPERRKTRVES